VTSPPELTQDLPHIHFGDAGTPHHEHAIPHAYRHDQGVVVLHLLEFVRQCCQVADILIGGGMGQHHHDPIDIDGPAILDQLVEQGDLTGGQLLGEKIRHHVEVGAMAQEERRRLVVPLAGRAVEQAAGILIEAEHHQCGLIRGGNDPLLLEQVTEDGDGGADRLYHLPFGVQGVVRFRVMVVDMDHHPGAASHLAEGADAVGLADIHQDQPGNRLQVDVAQAAKAVGVDGALDKEFT